MSARRARKGRTRPSTVTRPAAPCQRGHIDIDLLLEVRQKAFLLVLATDGLMCGDAEYIYETFSENEALSLLVHEVSEALAELGKQAEGKAEPEAAAVAS